MNSGLSSKVVDLHLLLRGQVLRHDWSIGIGIHILVRGSLVCDSIPMQFQMSDLHFRQDLNMLFPKMRKVLTNSLTGFQTV